jgi:hypothetical protein
MLMAISGLALIAYKPGFSVQKMRYRKKASPAFVAYFAVGFFIGLYSSSLRPCSGTCRRRCRCAHMA